jgi:hypothetical protein
MQRGWESSGLKLIPVPFTPSEDADRLSRVIELYQSGENFGRKTRVSEPDPAKESEPTPWD